MAKTFELNFNGYYIDINKSDIPNTTGIYCVYSCTYNSRINTVDLNKLIYIGQSTDIHKRIANHEKLNEWKSHLKSGEMLCYSYAQVPYSDLDRCEAALIYKHRPFVNEDYKYNFPHPETTITIKGVKKHLNTQFTIN